ncbi:hypothetical protein ACPCAE_13370 [Streptomyces cinereoruber]|uniref:hypothetical protein n=1 Tax=Streptomyces cinereoruber TaxID=67260 RepID=UPI00362B21B4
MALPDGRRSGTITEGAGSPDWSVRAAVGRRLASSDEAEQKAEVLLRLLLDPHDTAVTQDTANALLRRDDTFGLRQVLLALDRATSECTADELAAAVHFPERTTDEGTDRLLARLRGLTADTDAGVRREALALLAEMAPEES